ncbi:rhodanese-related sulfurtransferase [Gordonia sp. X0973]|uniref:oxygen-dependent tRNA uridine(34) hydroxylase TrhO n=1 Tax=Gordonia sp. X0973 TaxID=2742602 RepID=UPI000F51C7B6|nr:rhodanese-related sulfurtransferase [Gordonia sp. X0973]QKT07987.1 rhodanese-related sulfurtransferase [Gordonia sp. X0973]
MATPKIVLFYVFAPLADPEAIRLWQLGIASASNLRGRIVVSPHGINVTVGGDLPDVKRYVRATRQYPAFKNADVKWSDGTGADFPKLSVKVRPEMVTFGDAGRVRVDADGVVGGGVHLSPVQVNAMVENRAEEVVFLDGRNEIEAQIGRFRNAVVPRAKTTRDLLRLVDDGEFDEFVNRPVITYCTGGVRCEVLSSLLVERGFTEVYQIDGGIVRYAEEFGDDGLWEGSVYVFDGRMSVDYSDHTAVIGQCAQCGEPTKNVANYPDRDGRELMVVCGSCSGSRVP